MQDCLKKLFDMDKLQKLFESLHAATGIACSILGHDGEVIVSSIAATFCDNLCNHDQETIRSCRQCRRASTFTALETLHNSEGTCPLGLRYAIAPLVVEGDCRGAVMLNRVLLEKPDREEYQAIASRYGADQAVFMACIDAVPVLSEEQFRKHLELVTALTSLLADKGAAKLAATKTAERLRESELFLNLSQQIAQVGGWKANPETDQLQWTRQVYDMLELPRETPVSLSYAHQFLVSNQEQLALDIAKAWQEDYHFVTECELQTTTGKQFWVEFRCIGRIETQNGSWLAGTLQDSTLRKEAEKEMLKLLHQSEAASRLKTQLLANMSHELRTPLNGVLGCAQLLRMCGDLSPEQQEYVGLIDSSVSRELLLIEDLLEQSRQETAEVVITRSPCLLGQCVYEAVAVYQRVVREKGLSLTVTVSPELNREVLADKGRIRQILAALLDNALKFTAKGTITVSCSPLRQQAGSLLVGFTVGDTGIGIGEDALAHIFDPFTQEDMSNTRAYGGAGLGLSICRSLAQAMGGRIWAESRPGRGSSFHFELTVQSVGGNPSGDSNNA